MDRRYNQSADSEKHNDQATSSSSRPWILMFIWAIALVLTCTVVGITGAYMHDEMQIVRQQTGGSGANAWAVVALACGILSCLLDAFALFATYTGFIYSAPCAISVIFGNTITAGILLYVTVIYGRYFRPISCNQLQNITFGTSFWGQGVDHTFAIWGTSNWSRCGRAKAVPGLSGTVAGLLLIGCVHVMYLQYMKRRG